MRISLLCALLLTLPAHAKPTRPLALRDIRTLHVQTRGNASFGQSLRSELRAMGVRFAPRERADAILSARGSYNGEAFLGTAVLRARDGRVLWQGRARREPRQTARGQMAFSQLARQLRAVLRG